MISKTALKSIIVVMSVMLFCFSNSVAQDSTSFWKIPTEYNPQRGRAVAFGVTSAYTFTFGLLYKEWYSNYPQTKFHFFNDNNQWNQVDKCGHFGSAYYLSRWSKDLVRWTGRSNKSSAWIGAGMASSFLLTIEVMDGFSDQWGFSAGDFTANTLGSALFLAQELTWEEQRVTVKFSYHESQLAQYNPRLLGSTPTERVVKDYNGQTYWLSANVKSFLPKSSKFPAWLNIAVGYGADGMLGGSDNYVKDVSIIGNQQRARIRQFYLAPDIDLTKIPFRSNFLKSLVKVFGFIKFPAPTIEYQSTGKFVFHGLYF
jgi:hypothetical protein